MKRFFIAMLALLLAQSWHTEVYAQCSDNCKNCKRKKATTMKTNNNTFSCKLTSPELRKRKEEVISKLKKQVIERKELANGYSYKFAGTDQQLDELTEFIKTERQCCDFFDFRLSIAAEDHIWLEISGPKGVKEFITAELEM